MSRNGCMAVPAAFLTVLLVGLTCAAPGRASEEKVPVSGYRVVNSFPHDRKAFTQGLAWDGGVLLESTGLYGKSSLRRVSHNRQGAAEASPEEEVLRRGRGHRW